MKIGIVGGTFDPIHAAHAYLVEECRQVLDLDRVLVIPNGDPPHKDRGVTKAKHRYHMVKLALADFVGVNILDMEVARDHPSYTYETLETLRGDYPQDDFYFIMGADSLIGFSGWKRPDLIMKQATLVCFDRANYRPSEVAEAKVALEAAGGKVLLVDTLELEISSTDLRRRIKAGLPHQAFLHPKVYEYIHAEGLYREAGYK